MKPAGRIVRLAVRGDGPTRIVRGEVLREKQRQGWRELTVRYRSGEAWAVGSVDASLIRGRA